HKNDNQFIFTFLFSISVFAPYFSLFLSRKNTSAFQKRLFDLSIIYQPLRFFQMKPPVSTAGRLPF
ncbi:MAG: hypothetical protein K2P30_10835, partial [Lachnospiraceae bacterium]|nr:hypothetical protein [Lachnospiraceae bacterium]